MNIDDNVLSLMAYVRGLKDFVIVDSIDGCYNHMGATITDGILQAGVRYETVVRPRVKRLLTDYPEARTTSGFLHVLDQVGPNVLLQWKDAEKPNRVVGAAKFFQSERIETEDELAGWLQEPANIPRLKQLRGIGDKTADYFKILVGIQTVAVDMHLLAFLGAAGVTVRTYGEAHRIIADAADFLGVDRARFDHSIWKYLSTRKAKPSSCA